MDIILDDNTNSVAKQCLDAFNYDRNLPVEERFIDFPFNKAAICLTNTKIHGIYIPELEATRQFLEDNPGWKVPGGSIKNVSPCWGKLKKYDRDGGC